MKNIDYSPLIHRFINKKFVGFYSIHKYNQTSPLFHIRHYFYYKIKCFNINNKTGGKICYLK